MIYYVAPGGDNSGPGTESQPWATIGKANSALQPGDTAQIRQGAYPERIQPYASGRADSPIAYTCYPGEIVVLNPPSGAALYLYNRDWIEIEGLTVDAGRKCAWGNLEGGSRNTLKDIVLRDAIETTHGMSLKTSSYNRFIRVKFQTHGVDPEPLGGSGLDACKLHEGCHHNLFDQCDFTEGMHSLLNVAGGYNNIIRASTFRNLWYKLCDTGKGTYRNLWEGNIFKESHDIWENATRHFGSGIQHAASQDIIRQNVFYDNESGNLRMTIYADSPNNYDNRVYNNTMYHGGMACVPFLFNFAGDMSGNVFKNNILILGYYNSDPEQIWFSGGPGDMAGVIFTFCDIFNVEAGENVIGHAAKGDHPLAWWEANYPDNFANNLEVDPRFVDVIGRDFRLLPDSPLINAGTHLTEAVGTGSGDALIVADAGYFCDGWGIVDADWIKIGNGQPVQVDSIRYETNLIVLSETRTWEDGDPIYLYKNTLGEVVLLGDSPDIGAYEYQKEGGEQMAILKDGESYTFGDLEPGTYRLVGLVPAGWELVESPPEITVDVGQSVTVTFRYRALGLITVTVETEPDGATQEFEITLTKVE